MEAAPKYPEIKLDLNGPEGNAFYIMGAISRVLKIANESQDTIQSVLDDMKSSNYEHLCEVASRYITLYRSRKSRSWEE